MAIDKRIGNKLPEHLLKDTNGRIKIDPGPYVGIVKQVEDSTRSGRLLVYIPELGGPDPNDSKFWRSVSYASPFGGTTSPPPNATNMYGYSKNTYGFWMVPPDVGAQVLCTFVMDKGYWFACVTPDLSHHMTPAIGSVAQSEVDVASVQNLDKFIPPGYQNRVVAGNKFPVSEFNINNENAYTSEFYKTPKPIHPYEFKKLVDQGLEGDTARGTISSSSQRETPSAVFGFSTPGRAVRGLPGVKDSSDTVTARMPGHSFIMDDGDKAGKDQLIRLRTAAGHQIMLNDSEGTVYVSNASGRAWFEMTANGQIYMYGQGGINLRTEGSMNFHADQNISFNAGKNVLFASGTAFVAESQTVSFNGKKTFAAYGQQTVVQSGSSLTLLGSSTASLVSGGSISITAAKIALAGGAGGKTAQAPADLPRKGLPDVQYMNPGWTVVPGKLATIVSIAPTHEPFNRSQQTTAPTEVPDVTVDADGNVVSGVSPGTPVGPENAYGKGVNRPAPESSLLKQPDAIGEIGNLDKDGVKAYMAQTGYSESGGDYTVTNQYGYLGKYQMGAGALIDQGYVKPGTTQSGLSDPNNWTGKDGMNSPNDFLATPTVQEKTMQDYTTRNYNALVSKGVITSETSAEDTAGYLSVSHLLGAGGATKWYNGSGGADANGTTGDDYFNRGRYSQVVLASTTTTSTRTA